MAKTNPNSGLERTARLLDLVPFLTSHQGIALSELASAFSISQSQLTEDLTTLWMCGLPGYTALELMDLSFDSGFVNISNAETLAHPRTLDRDEVLALILGLETILEAILESMNPTQGDLSSTVLELISKLSDFLDSNIQNQVVAGTSNPSLARGEIEKAISTRSSIRISYHSITRDAITDREIHPLEFTISNGVEYLFAFCETAHEYRTFRLDRILSIGLAGKPSEIAPESLSKGGDRKIEMDISVTSRFRDASERFDLAALNFVSNPAQTSRIESFGPDWPIREIMSFGGDVCLVSPQDLRDSLRERALRALNGYLL